MPDSTMSSMDESSTSGGDNISVGSSMQRAEEELSGKETRGVMVLRVGVIIVLVVAAVLVSTGIYLYTSDTEKDDFEMEFKGHATKVVEVFERNLEEKLAALESFVFTMSSYAIDQNLTWPFVTIPHFEARAHRALTQSDSLALVTAPFIYHEFREEWEEYVVENSYWIAESKAYQQKIKEDEDRRFLEDMAVFPSGFCYSSSFPPPRADDQAAFDTSSHTRSLQGDVPDIPDFSSGISDRIWRIGPPDFVPIVDVDSDMYFPVWQHAPHLANLPVENRNMDDAEIRSIASQLSQGYAVFGSGADLGDPDDPDDTLFAAIKALITYWYGDIELFKGEAVLNMYYPVFADLDSADETVGITVLFFLWRSLFTNILPPTAVGVTVVLRNSCGAAYTYEINGRVCTYVGVGDSHDTSYDYLVQETGIEEYINSGGSGRYSGRPLAQNLCQYSVHVYPSQRMENEYVTALPITFTMVALTIFVFTSIVFIIYDRLVEHRQNKVMNSALQSGAIVSSIFPKAIQERLMAAEAESASKSGSRKHLSANRRVKSFLAGSDELDAKPIADLFPHTTVMFADIASFTAWSSSREPGQVFALLQKIYQSFDKIAKKYSVFKVETVGDCYVAVSGVPEANKDHAIMMARFASGCLVKMNELISELEIAFGPDTGDIRMRFGLHSGPCTGGVLRGDKARFQLFGDTVNMAARMESTGIPNKIQISKATAKLLKDAGKGNWVTAREEQVTVKGKGQVSTFWLSTSRQSNMVDQVACSDARKERLIEWCTEMLLGHLRKVVARRMVVKGKTGLSNPSDMRITQKDRKGLTCLEEVEDVLSMPPFDPEIAAKETNPDTLDLGLSVKTQMRLYVHTISNMYHDNPFHNFEHATHVALAVEKLLSRVVDADVDVEDVTERAPEEGVQKQAMGRHDYTHGITSDPLTQFAIVLSAVIHDVDHRGVSNMQFGLENPRMAEMYKQKSIAEQNSVDLAWEVLMNPEFKELRNCIYTDAEELKRFRQSIINVVLATDIFDKELNDLRKQRWERAFSEQVLAPSIRGSAVNTKATIVIEHLIQASDVSHTMQHWHVYRKWNERLFSEMYRAFKAGRMGKDPSTFWYKGELGFYDNYIIPLTKKLKECNVFGVSSDEYLSYAVANREEWEEKGEQIVSQLVEKCQEKYGSPAEGVGITL